MSGNSLFSFLCTIMNYIPKTNNLDAKEKSQLLMKLFK